MRSPTNIPSLSASNPGVHTTSLLPRWEVTKRETSFVTFRSPFGPGRLAKRPTVPSARTLAWRL